MKKKVEYRESYKVSILEAYGNGVRSDGVALFHQLTRRGQIELLGELADTVYTDDNGPRPLCYAVLKNLLKEL